MHPAFEELWLKTSQYLLPRCRFVLQVPPESISKARYLDIPLIYTFLYRYDSLRTDLSESRAEFTEPKRGVGREQFFSLRAQ